MKFLFRNIHLYLSLAAGLVIFTSCVTGLVLVFENEITQALHKDRYDVVPLASRLPLDSLVNIVKREVKSASIISIKVPVEATRSVEISYSEKNESPAIPVQDIKQPGKAKNNQKAERRIAFVNPYTGQVLALFNYKSTFFYWVMTLHRSLLAGDMGKLIVGSSAIIFTLILLTGIMLWWPKSRKILEQRLQVKWNANWKRLTHDLHVVLGFYAFFFLLTIALTGIGMSFGIFKPGQKKAPKHASQETQAGEKLHPEKISLEQALSIARTHFGEVNGYNISFPSQPGDALTIGAVATNATHENAADIISLDPVSGRVISTALFNDRDKAAIIYSIFKPIHTGTIFGLPSKILLFFVVFFGASFPITGTIMWWNRTRKKRKVKSEML